jgi:hypothetical protein
MENLPGMKLMLHKHESKSKGENYYHAGNCQFKAKEGRTNPAFLFSA